jgi:hypothetical protein
MIFALIGVYVYKEIGCDLPKMVRRVFLCVLIVMVIGSPILMLKSAIVTDATYVATIYATANSEEKGLFQERDTGKYFVMVEDNLDPWNATYREYVDTEVAEKYIEKYNELKEFEIIGK